MASATPAIRVSSDFFMVIFPFVRLELSRNSVACLAVGGDAHRYLRGPGKWIVAIRKIYATRCSAAGVQMDAI